MIAEAADLAIEECAAPPFEVRSPSAAEAEQARALQQTAFAWPDGSPPTHPGSREELRVVLRDGRVVSCLTLLHAELVCRGASVPMAGIRHVATHPSEQNQGYASALLRDTLRGLRRRGLVTSVLFPFSFRYYRKFGYELGGNSCHYWCRPNCIPAYDERREVRTGLPEDAPALAAYYRRQADGQACCVARDEARWRALMADLSCGVLIHGDRDLDGYAVVTETRDSYGGRLLRVLDLAASTPRAWRALLGRLSQAAVESIEWLASATGLTASGLMRSPAPLREGFKPRGIATVRPMFQLRVTDVEGALSRRFGAASTPVAAAGRLALRVSDDLLPENGTPVAIHSAGGRLELRPARPSDPHLDLDIRAFSQIFSGYMSAGEAVSQGLARCSSPAALEFAEQLFPPGEPFISELDRF